ncbi:hypothetical protein K1719_042278 [Acacia pycnantha]|nr:hypothetical protein K1719_042278 [Acacia pycnantha]
MEEVCLNSEPLFDECDEFDVENSSVSEHDQESLGSISKNHPPPTVGLEFDSFEEAYNFYNVYAKEQGFGIRVSNSWFRSRRKERYRAKLSCSSAGFKKKSDAHNPRPETRTGCPAMIVIRMVDSKIWRIVEVELQHNHQVEGVLHWCYWAVAFLVAQVFPHARHCYSLQYIMHRVPEKLGGLKGYETIRKQLNKAVYESLKIVEFENYWADMIKQHGLGDNKWLQTLYNDRHLWVPVYLKDTFLAGTVPTKENEGLIAYFDGYVHKHASFKEFIDKYDLALHRKNLKEAMAELESRKSSVVLNTRCNFELQLSKLYTKEIFKKFQSEVDGMYSCFNTRQVNVNGSIITYIVKERVENGGNEKEIKKFEVLYEANELDIRCICGLFNYKGYLCRHALNVLNYNGVEEVPSRFILQRWKKDFKQRFIQDHDVSGNADTYDPVAWHKQLFHNALPVLEEGAQSQEHYMIALLELEQLLNEFDLF